MKNNIFSTGISELDTVINSLRKGDNVVLQVDSINLYRQFAKKFAQQSIKKNEKLVYLRFAEHEPLLNLESKQIKIHLIKTIGDFENFTGKIYNIITKEGFDANYIFDSLSDLLTFWATDLMISNFFKIICPYLYKMNTIAYFALLHNNHSYQTISDIRETTQVFLNIYSHNQTNYLHPIKVENRYSSSMFLPHIYQNKKYIPITDSLGFTNLFSDLFNKKNNLSQNIDYWDKLFLKAQNLIENKNINNQKKDMLFNQICTFMLSRNKKILPLVKKHFCLNDLIKIKSRMIGTGLIGGKALGMLLARKILINHSNFDQEILEQHDSFYIGSDVFYTYIVYNGWWELKIKQKTKTGYFQVASQLKDKFLQGAFPERIIEEFKKIIDYFGQSPIIVRSSSFLEDSYGNAFAGKYDSFYCVNQGDPKQRLENFMQAIRRVYASSMSKEALSYRYKRKLTDKDEQMSLLVQRVSGGYHKNYYFPHLAGVGNSYNNYAWNNTTNPEAGLLRLVMGLGTRAVNRTNTDYTRIVALDKVRQRIFSGKNDERKYSQKNIDLLDMKKNQLTTISISKLMGTNCGPKIDFMNFIGLKDHQTNKEVKLLNINKQEYWIINFNNLLTNTSFSDIIKKILKLLAEEYSYPVDIEFTVNFFNKEKFKINLLQCRPLQTNFNNKKINIPANINHNKLLFSGKNTFMGGSFKQKINTLIYVNPDQYSQLKQQQKYDVARHIGIINEKISSENKANNIILIGPGRWGSSTPSLGVPVNFSEIDNTAILVEVATEYMSPELSYGSHFFQDLIESDIKYIALYPQKNNYLFKTELILQVKNSINELLTNRNHYDTVIHVVNFEKESLSIITDIYSQKFIAYIE